MMTDENRKIDLKLWTPAIYRIEVSGDLPAGCSDRLREMSVKTRPKADQVMVTTLTGQLRDQAELVGVLNGLYELHLPILNVKLVRTAP